MSARMPGRVEREVLRRHLEALGELRGVRGAVLFSPDGFEVASYSVDKEASMRLAAIGSSLAALGSAIASEAGLDSFDRTLIEGHGGTVMITRVDGEAGLALAVIANPDVVLGRLLWGSKHCCDEIQKTLQNETVQSSRQPAR
ncbi:MAG TPA: roadblock/LC7 domain-containing protein [Chiayiivirga sp.]|nr:roadblock/LC7 domain-containing protein [Chiayiivirga sp.]